MTGVAAVIVAAGSGRRFGAAKQFAPLRGRPLVEWSLAAFEAHPLVETIVLVLPDLSRKDVYRAGFPKVADVVRGGAERQDSVAVGVGRLDAARTEIVLVHDGARPFVSAALIDRVAAAAARTGAAVPVVPVEDTIKEVEADRVVRTCERGRLCRAQTPQGFSFGLLVRALTEARAAGVSGTDEAALVERLGAAVAVVEGDPRNIKITSLLDLRVAEALGDENRPRV
jgi:2-C-methyl-D-erythritol 4-phosphate cytidylyltransferase